MMSSEWAIDVEESPYDNDANASLTPSGKEYYTFVVHYKKLSPIQLVPQHGLFTKEGAPIYFAAAGSKGQNQKCSEGTKDSVKMKKVVKWTTKMEVLKSMPESIRGACNSLKTFLSKHEVAVFYHNACTDVCSQFGGPHLHVIMKSGKVASGRVQRISDITAFRTLRKKIVECGGYLRVQGVYKLPGLMWYCCQAPRVFMGTNSKDLYKLYNIACENCRVQPEDTYDSCVQEEEEEKQESFENDVEWTGFEDDLPSTSTKRKGEWSDEEEFDVQPSKKQKVTLKEGKDEEFLRMTRVLARRFNAYTVSDLFKAVGKGSTDKKHAKYKDLWYRMASMTNIKKWLEVVKQQDECEVMYMPFAQLINEYCLHKPDSPHTESAEESYQAMLAWLEHQHIDPIPFVDTVFAIMDRTLEKVNTLCIIGDSNAGKTVMITTPLRELAQFTGMIGNRGSNSDFVYMELPNKRLCVIDECIMNPVNLEDLKLLLGGEKMKVNVKFQGMTEVERIPCIITGNRDPWCLDYSQREPLMNRCVYYSVAGCLAMKGYKQMSPKMWWYLMQLRGRDSIPEMEEMVPLGAVEEEPPDSFLHCGTASDGED